MTQTRGIDLTLDTVSMDLINPPRPQSESWAARKLSLMKPVSPLVDIATPFVFLIALTITCVQASQITLDSVWASVPVFGESVSTKTDQSAFLVADDESDDSANLGIARDIISPIEAVQFFHTRSRWFVVVVKVKHATVLRI